MGNVVLLVGISGAGKSTVGEALERRLGFGYVYATGANLERLRPGEALNLLDQGRTYEVNGELLESLEPGDGTVLVHTHATYPLGDGFVRLTPPGAARLVNGVVLLEADPRTIRARRLSRGRPLEATELESIRREAEAERAEARRLAEVHGIPTCVLDTTSVPLDRALPIVCRFVEGLPSRERVHPF